MLGKTISVSAAGAFMLALFGGGAMYVFQNRDENPAAQFVAALNQKDAKTLSRLLNRPLSEHTDPAVLQLWVDAVAEAVGTVSIADAKKIQTQQTTVEGEARQAISAPLNGTRQNASLELELAGGGVNRFEVLSDAIDPNWCEKLTQVDLYREEAEAFLKALLGQRPDDAYALLHADSRDLISLDEIRRMSETLHAQAGPLKGNPAFVGSQLESESQLVSTGGDGERRLRLVYDIECDSGARTRAALDFKLEGFRFFLIAFDLTGGTEL